MSLKPNIFCEYAGRCFTSLHCLFSDLSVKCEDVLISFCQFPGIINPFNSLPLALAMFAKKLTIPPYFFPKTPLHPPAGHLCFWICMIFLCHNANKRWFSYFNYCVIVYPTTNLSTFCQQRVCYVP